MEVKTRTEGGMLPPFAAVTKSKQKKIVLAALRYLQEHPAQQLQPRFDIAEVIVSKEDSGKILGHRLFENAFSPEEEYRYF